MTEKPDISSLFNPQHIAIVGASTDPSKLGFNIVDNIVSNNYTGRLYPINPKGGEVLGTKIYPTILDVPEDSIDMAVIVIPAHRVFAALEECAKKKVKFLVMITSGFSEIGNHEDEEKIADYAKEHNMRILGPNIFGVYSKSMSLNATFGPKNIKPGKVAILTQSGAIGIGMIGKTAMVNLGLSTIISTGNKVDVDETELIEYLMNDKGTNIIMMYMEGVKDGEKFIKILKKATKKKPVIVIKSGCSKRGAMATASHTGSLAGEDAVFEDIMKQCGVLRAESLKEGLDWASFLVEAPKPKGKNAVIITNGGGLGVMATDACEKYKVELYDDQENLSRIYKDSVISFGSTKNPIDLTGGATGKDYDMSIQDSLDCDDVHAIIGLYCETSAFAGEELPQVIETKFKKAKELGKPIAFALFGGEKVEGYVKKLTAKNVPAFGDVYEAVNCMGTLYRYCRRMEGVTETYEDTDVDIASIQKVVKEVKADKRQFLLAEEAQNVMKAAGIRVPASEVATSADEAVKFADQMGYPVVMKIVSKDIIHKSDAGGVVVGLKTASDVREAFDTIMANAKKYKADAVIKGVEVTEMVKKGLETIVGGRKDASFGPIVMVGLGGVYVEVFKDVAFRAVPLNKVEATKMVKSIKAKPLLKGVRGEAPKDIPALVDVVMKIGKIIQQCDDITDIEINPVMVYEDGVCAVDVRILLTE